MKLVPSTQEDIKTIQRWSELDVDPDHRCIAPMWWLTGVDGSLLSFCFQDDRGPVCYVRLDEKDKDGLIKLHTQFAPREDVSRDRLVDGMIKGFPIVMQFCREQGAVGIMFESKSPTLIYFMKKNFGFISLDKDDLYVLCFKSENTV